MKRLLVSVILLSGILYVCDYLYARYRIEKGGKPFGTVKVQRYYSVQTKSGKPDFYFFPPENQVCVYSLFPHFGHNPCWYVKRHKVIKVEI